MLRASIRRRDRSSGLCHRARPRGSAPTHTFDMLGRARRQSSSRTRRDLPRLLRPHTRAPRAVKAHPLLAPSCASGSACQPDVRLPYVPATLVAPASTVSIAICNRCGAIDAAAGVCAERRRTDGTTSETDGDIRTGCCCEQIAVKFKLVLRVTCAPIEIEREISPLLSSGAQVFRCASLHSALN